MIQTSRKNRAAKLHLYTLLFCLLSGTTLVACRNDKPDSVERAEDKNERIVSVPQSDLKFAAEAASGGLMEVQMGVMAREQGASQSVKDLGQMMIDDHSAANEELKHLAASKGITLPMMPGENEQEKINKLAPKLGADFDQAYVDMMVSDHEADIAKFEDEVRNGNDAELKSWAEQKLPVLRRHLEMTRSLQQRKK